jgi:hypothetical protein
MRILHAIRRYVTSEHGFEAKLARNSLIAEILIFRQARPSTVKENFLDYVAWGFST